MHIESLNLRNFRNYENICIDFGKHANILYGKNAQGKTNVLEAIYMCASARSHRTSKDAELLRFGSDSFEVRAQVDRQPTGCSIEISYSELTKKRVSINTIPVQKIGELMGNLNAVMFSPEDLMMIKEGPSERRKFMDIAISQLRPAYFYKLQQYSRVLLQRNNLLKEIQIKRSLLDTLDIWNDRLAELGASIIMARLEFINRLSLISKEIHGRLTDGSEEFVLKYLPSFQLAAEENDISGIKRRFIAFLEKNVEREIMKGVTMAGSHRDDFNVIINDLEARQFGSQGQQRTSVLSLKLAEAAYMEEQTGEAPVLLLDDVMSELDSRRQNKLMDFIRNKQAFITCTDGVVLSEGLNSITEARYYRVDNGTIKSNEFLKA